jgi:hypothetical protein
MPCCPHTLRIAASLSSALGKMRKFRSSLRRFFIEISLSLDLWLFCADEVENVDEVSPQNGRAYIVGLT